jgi:hypothetical protein
VVLIKWDELSPETETDDGDIDWLAHFLEIVADSCEGIEISQDKCC